MANTYGISRIKIGAGRQAPAYSPTVVYRALHAAATFLDGAVLKNDGAGLAQESANDPTTAILYGIALHNAGALYLPQSNTVPVFDPVYTGRFGYDGTAGLVSDPGYQQIGIAAGVAGQVFEATGVLAAWAASMVGGQFALEKDATSGYWVVDLSDTVNKSVNVLALKAGPLPLSNGTGYGIPAVGDTNVRVLFTFMAGVLDPSVSSL